MNDYKGLPGRRAGRSSGVAALAVAGLLLASATAAAVTSASTTTGTSTTTHTPATLNVSSSATRTNPLSLAGATLSGNQYIFAPAGTDTTGVDFYLDGTLYRHEGISPYDFAGTTNGNINPTDPAYPWDTTKVANGGHTIREITYYSDSTSASSSATFTVANGTAATPSPTPTPTPTPASQPASCGTSLQSLINNTPSGGTLTVPACLYREAVTIGKPMTMTTSGAMIKGSDVWTSWSSNGALWVSSLTVPSMPTNSSCLSTSPQCGWPEQVFVDGSPLLEVAPQSTPLAGQFALDSYRHIVLASNPSGHTIEVTTRMRWVTISASGVTIQGFRMLHVADEPQRGGIDAMNVSNVTIRSDVLSDSHGALININGGSGHQILNSELFRGGQEGYHLANVSSSLVAHNHIHNNNVLGYQHAGECGGGKASTTTNLTVDSNEVDHNACRGLWFDPNNSGIVVSNNKIHDNDNEGVLIEISYSGKVFGNAVWNNGWQYYQWGYGAGILVSSTPNVEVYNNTVAWNARQICVISQDRGSTAYLPRNEYVHNNFVAGTDNSSDPNSRWALAFVQDWSGGMYDAGSNNRGAANAVWYATPEGATRYGGWNAWNSLAYYNTTPGGGGNSYYMSSTQKDSQFTAAGVPLAPPAHQ